MAKKLNQWGLQDIKVPRDPRDGSIIERPDFDHPALWDYQRDAAGNMVMDPNGRTYARITIPYHLEENKPFLAEIEVKTISPGKGTVHIEVENTSTGESFNMHLSTFMDLLKTDTIVKGTIKRNWGFMYWKGKIFICPAP